MNDFTFFYGAASNQSRKSLKQLEEPNVMINYATQQNKPWGGIDNLFIDSGGYSFMKGKGEYETSNSEYLDFKRRIEDTIAKSDRAGRQSTLHEV